MKKILVTGANRGLGLGLVKKFWKMMKVICTTRNLSKSKEYHVKKNIMITLKFVNLTYWIKSHLIFYQIFLEISQ